MIQFLLMFVLMQPGEIPEIPLNKSEQVYVLLEKYGEGAVLATIDEDNAPYLSSAPIVLNKKGQPVVFLSDLALHTKNINKSPKVSVIVNQPDKKGSYFNGARATVKGTMVQVTDEKEVAECRKKYLDNYREAEDWADFGDFHYYRLEFTGIYFIGGFGEIDWLDLDEYKSVVSELDGS